MQAFVKYCPNFQYPLNRWYVVVYPNGAIIERLTIVEANEIVRRENANNGGTHHDQSAR